MPDTPLLDREGISNANSSYLPPVPPEGSEGIPFQNINSTFEQVGSLTTDGQGGFDYLKDFNSKVLSSGGEDDGKLRGGSPIIPASEVQSDRYKYTFPGKDVEDIYSQGQSNWDKAVNGLLKGTELAGTTFLNGTIGLIYGITAAIGNKRFASLFDNDFSRAMQSLNEKSENILPNYYSAKERDANWYEPANLLKANFFWDKIIKNLGYLVGAYLSGGVLTKALKLIPGIAALQKAGMGIEAADAMENAINTAPQVEKLDKAAESIKAISDKTNNLYHFNPLKGTDRFMISALSTFGEAGMESLQNMNQYRDQMIKEYTDLHSEAPIGDDLNAINKESEKVGNASWWLNLVLLTGTNYIQLGKILGSSYKGGRSVFNDIVSNELNPMVEDAETGLFKSGLPQKGFGKFLYKSKNIAGLFFSPNEAFEEGAQNAIQEGSIDYYNKARQNKEHSFLDSMAEGWRQTYSSKSGMEQILIGGFSGALVEAGLVGADENGKFGVMKGGKIGERGFTGYGGEMAVKTQEAINNINNNRLSKFTKDGVDSVNRSLVLQQDWDSAIRQGDILSTKNAEFDYAHNYLAYRIKYGRFDTVINDINTFKNLAATDDGFSQLQKEGKASDIDNKEDFIKRLNNFEEHAKNVKSLYESLHVRYGSLVDKEGNKIFADDIMDKMVYTASKVADYDTRMKDLSTSLINNGVQAHMINEAVLQSAAWQQGKAEDVVREKSVTQAITEAVGHINNMDVLEEVKDKLKTNLADYFELTTRRKVLLDEYKEIKKNPNNFKTPDVKPVDVEPTAKVQTPTIRVKTLDGDEDLEVGTPYYLGNVSYNSEQFGKNAKYLAFPEFTILGSNEDGTIKIKTNEGSIRDIDPKLLKNHKIGKVSDTINNKKANFYRLNANTIYRFNFGKGETQDGRLQYSPKKGILNFVYKDSNGKIITKEVTRDQFKAKKGFNQPQIEPIGKLTKEQQQASDEYTSQKDDRFEEKRASVLSTLSQLSKEVTDRIKQVGDKIENKKIELKDINTKLDEIRRDIEENPKLTKKGTFKKATKSALSAANKLSDLRDSLQSEIQSLEDEKKELEFNKSYVDDYIQNINELPTDSKDLLEELKSQQGDIQSLIIDTGLQINNMADLVKKTEDAIQSALDFAFDLIEKFQNTYPFTPTSSIELAQFIANQNRVRGEFMKGFPSFLQENPTIIQDMLQLESGIASLEEGEIKPNEKKLKDLQSSINNLTEKLSDFEKEYTAKKVIYDRFKKADDEFKKEQEELDKLKKQKGFVEKVFGKSQGKRTNSPEEDAKKAKAQESWNARKTVYQIASTTDPSAENGYAQQTETHKRHNQFLNNIDNLPNRSDLRVVLLHKGNESLLGLGGLVDKALEGFPIDKRDPANTIIAVYTDSNHIPVDVNGKSLKKEDSEEFYNLDNIIFSTMASTSTKNAKGGDRFRESEQGQTGVNTISKLVDWYKKLRSRLLGSPELKSYEFSVSTGIPNHSEGNPKNAVTKNLVLQEDLNTPGLVQISTNGALSINGVAKRFPIGRPVLVKGSTAAFLNNRNITKDESNIIFDSFRNLASTATGENWNKAVAEYLRGILFFGEPNATSENAEDKIPGRNQFWVKDGRLFIGKEGFSVDFTPQSLDRNKEKLLAILQGAYNNVNNNYLKKGEPFNEIVDFKDGKPETRTWKSYQHYLLSDKYELDPSLDDKGLNGKQREGQIPLTTDLIIPQEGEINAPFKNRYSAIVPSEEESYKEAIKPEAKKSQQPSSSPFDGKTVHKILTSKGEEIYAAPLLNGNQIEDTGIFENKGNFRNAVDRLKLNGETEDSAYELLENTVAKYVFDSLKNQTEKEKETRKETVVPVSTTSNTKLDINALKAKYGMKSNGSADRATRLINSLNVPRMSNEDWDVFRNWAKKAIPQVPIETINHIIEKINGGSAWGVFENGAIKLYESAEKGTEYHEAFESVWGMFVSDQEQQKILKEFNNRKGNFIERGSSKPISYKDATLSQAKEKIADEFADFKLTGIKPQTSGLVSHISRFFNNLWNFIKGLFGSKNDIQDLFKKIDKGNFSKAQPLRRSESAEYSTLTGSSEELTRQIMEEVGANVAFALLGDKTASPFYGLDKISASLLYDKVKKLTVSHIGETISDLIALHEISDNLSEKKLIKNQLDEVTKVMDLVENQWDEIVSLNKNFIRSLFRIKVTQEVTIEEEENKNKNEYTKNDFFLDNKQSASTAIKLLFNTLVEADKSGKEISSGVPDIAKTFFGGSKLLKSSKSFIKVMDELSNTSTLKEMLNKVYNLGNKNPDFKRLFIRLKGNILNGQLDPNNLSFNDWRLLFDFNNTFSKQSPKPFIIFNNKSGETYMQPADLNSLVNSTVNTWVSNLRAIAKKGGNDFIKKIKSGKIFSYNITPAITKAYTGSDNKTLLANFIIPKLAHFGINIDPTILNKLSQGDITNLKEASESLLMYTKLNNISTITKDNLGSTGALSRIAEIILRNSDIEMKAVYFNIDNEQQQLYVNHNYFSKFTSEFNNTESLQQFKEEHPEYNDIFLQSSIIFKLGGPYFNNNGKRGTKQLEIGYLNGVQNSNISKSIDKLSSGERLMATINSNLNGWYNIIMPSDSATEWMIKLDNQFKISDIQSDNFNKKIRSIFGDYLKDEINLAIDSINRNPNLNRDKEKGNLRLFENIVSEGLKNKINRLIESNPSQKQVNNFITSNIENIEKSVKSFLNNEASIVKDQLTKEGKLVTYTTEYGNVNRLFGLDSQFSRNQGWLSNIENEEEQNIQSHRLSDKDLNSLILTLTSNFAVANNEMLKVIFGDPAQFKNQQDALKRIKSFGSPRNSIYSGEEANNWLNQNMNKVRDVQLSPTDYGFTNFDDNVKTYTIDNFIVLGLPAVEEGNMLYENVDRSDAQMWAMPTFYREVMIKSSGSSWNEDAEKLFQYDAASFRQYYANRNKAYRKAYNKNIDLVNQDNILLRNGLPEEYKANPLKPIITGHKNGINYIDTMLDKQSAFPLFFSFTEEGSHLREHFIQNFEQGMDYSIVPTGRKVGTQTLHNFYTPDGKINKSPIPESSKFEFPITNFGIQQETSSIKTEGVRGTQITKEVSLNLFDSGIPIDTNISWEKWSKMDEKEREKASPLYKELNFNIKMLDAITDHGYNTLLNKLSIEDNGFEFVVKDPTILQKTLENEVFRRESNDNIIDSIKLDDSNNFKIAFEASNNYQTIKNILLSIVDKNVISPKINGGSKIQVSSAMWDNDSSLQPYIKTKDGYKKVENFDELSESEKKKVRLFSNKLKFYRKGEDGSIQHTQILLPHWFGEQLKNSKRFKNDSEILKYLNSTEEGKSILRGFGFRIPTQEINSAEAFEVAGFLPQALGDTVVVPAEITTKAGSDFDVDKLNVYLKNVYLNTKGDIKLIPYKGIGEEAKKALKDEVGSRFLLNIKDVKSNPHAIENLNSEDTNDESLIDNIYKKSLQNAYIQSLENLLLAPQNYDRLIKPNSNNGMDKLRDELNEKLGDNELFANKSQSPLLSMGYINNQRHNSIVGKYSIGIGAVSQANHSLTQKSPIYIDPERIERVPSFFRKFLGDGSILLKHNQININGKIFSTLSGIKDKVGQYISDKISAYINGFVDISKDTFIVELGATPKLAGTFLLLERLGVPTKTVIYFMNQPIIREYLKNNQSNNIRSLYNRMAIEDIESQFGDSEAQFGDSEAKTINEKDLPSNIEKYYKNNKRGWSVQDNAQQRLIFREFLKYTVLANQLRVFTQATTWDTANFSDFSLLKQKQLLYDGVQEHSVFNSPDNIMNTTFLGNLRDKILKASLGMSAFLKLQSSEVQSVLDRVLKPMIDPEENFISTRDVIKAGNKITASFLDYLIHTKFNTNNSPLSSSINRILIQSSNIAEKVKAIKNDKSNPLNDNYAFQRIGYDIGNQEGEVNNITNKLTDKDSFSQNQFITGLREIKAYDKKLYNDIVLGMLLQSGNYKSPISFTDLIPVEDYGAIINPIINNLDNTFDYQDFADNALFQRNNWNDQSIVPVIQEKVRSKIGNWYNQISIIGSNRSPLAVKYFESLGIKGQDLPIAVPSHLASSEIITIRRDNFKDFTQQQINDMKRKGDYSYKITAGFQIVRDSDGNPLTLDQVDKKTGIVYTKNIYKPINLYGDGIYAQEYYNDTRPSVINNGTYKIANEIPNSIIYKGFEKDFGSDSEEDLISFLKRQEKIKENC